MSEHSIKRGAQIYTEKIIPTDGKVYREILEFVNIYRILQLSFQCLLSSVRSS